MTNAVQNESIARFPATPKVIILLVDDIVENLELLQDLLPEYGFDTRTASSGIEALEQLNDTEIHVIISDAMMPKMDGFEFCKTVKKNPALASIPFIIYTGDYVDEEDEELAKSIGVDRYIAKMSGIESLVDAVRNIVLERYGLETQKGGLESVPLDDQSFLERHHALVVKKLEQKMNELELFAHTLSRKNKELQTSEGRYRGLFEQASIAIYVLHRNTYKVADVNKHGLALLGHSREDLVAMERFPFESSEADVLMKLQHQDEFFGEADVATKDGRQLQVEISAGTFGQGDESKVLLFARDVTEQKKMREMLAQAEKMTLMGTLASGIAHEIRNPLAAVALNLQYLEQKLEGGSAMHGSVLSALEGARRIETVIDNTLGLARMKPPDLREHSMNQILTQALGFLRLVIQQKNLVITTQLDDGLPSVHVDVRQIQQVFINVLQNAVDATPAGSAIVVKTYCIEQTLELVDERPAESNVVVSIRDSGPGIPPERMKDLFEPFKTTKSGGTGLGLALSKRILARHQADIQIESAEGGGTLIRLIFPTQIQNER
jgi:PAS domain S-box-containing protein